MRRRTLVGLGLAAAAGTNLAGPALATGPALAGSGPRRAAGQSWLDDGGVHRTELYARSDPGIRIHVREIIQSGAETARAVPLLLVHGARPDGVSAFDLPVPGGSLAADFAHAGHPVYVMDVRGFGSSSYPDAMGKDPAASAPLVRSTEAVRDVAAAVDLIRARRGVERIAALGWATGGHWLGMYATQAPEKLSDLVILNSLYSGTSPWPLQSELEDPANPGHPLPQPGWRAVTADSLTARWDAQVPKDDPDSWRDPAVRTAYREHAIAADPTSGTRTPPSFRNPTGSLIDAFYLAQGRQFYDASLIHARTLVVRGQNDFWSRVEDADRLAAHLTSAPEVRSVTIPDALHYLHLDRPEHGRARLIAETQAFLSGE